MLSELMTLLRRHGLTLDSRLDEQHLINRERLENMLQLAGIGETETVLEIGAGCGDITEALAQRAKRVFAVEKKKYLSILDERLSKYPNTEVLVGDALELNLPPCDKIISNLPFSICEALFQKLIYSHFILAVLIVPEPFAGILLARPTDPKYSKLSLLASSFYDIEVKERLDPNDFYPAPRGNSLIITMKPKTASSLDDRLVRSLFLQRDKKTKNAIRKTLTDVCLQLGEVKLTKRKAREITVSLGLDQEVLNSRVGRLSLDQFLEVSNRLVAACTNLARQR